MRIVSWELWVLTPPAGRSRKELRENGPPRVLEPLKDVVLIEGSAAKLTCRISAFPDPFIRWSKDGKELRDGPKYRYIFEDPDVVALVVRDGELADLGQYSINVTNPFGQCSDSARILVEGTRARGELPPRRAAPSRGRPRPGLASRLRLGLAQPPAQGEAQSSAQRLLGCVVLPYRGIVPLGVKSPLWASTPNFRAPRSQRARGRARGRALVFWLPTSGKFHCPERSPGHCERCKHPGAFTPGGVSFDPPFNPSK